MTYEQVETFLAVVSCGNISDAAKRLFVSQSTVSSRLAQLEEELGIQLMLRHKGQRTIELTNYGDSFIPLASQWAALWKDTQHLKTLADIQEVSIASVDAVNNYTLLPMFQRHLAQYPGIRLSINTHHSGEIYSLVQSRRADIGFVLSRITHPDIVSKPVYRELMYLICHKGSHYSDGIICEELKTKNEIYLRWGTDYQQWHDSHWSPDEYPRITVNTGSMLQRFLYEPELWAIAPMSVIRGAISANPDLTYYRLNTPPTPRICYEIKNRYPKKSLEEPIRFIEQELTAFIASDPNICTFQDWMLSSSEKENPK